MLYELSQKYKRIAIVGMAKNAGKTTTLNYFLEEAMDEEMVVGVTSTGRDGERTDLVTGTDKPSIWLEEGMLVSVPVQLYDLADAGLEILRKTEYGTSLGPILLCRVASSGYVQVAGPVINAQHESLCAEMIEAGAEVVLIDGAIDRKSIAAPETSDAIILSTGAVLSRQMRTVIEETAHTVGLYRLPRLEEGPVRGYLEDIGDDERIQLIRDGALETLPVRTGLGAGKILAGLLNEKNGKDISHIFLPGAFTPGSIDGIDPRMMRRITFVLKDPTRIFFPPPIWRKMRKWGLNVTVLENINVAALTVNPTSPFGYRFDQQQLVQAMQAAIPEIPVIDVME
ncbi:MAG: hypothetical protein IJ109_00250 [Firmicutes bacterium]|nr:hypothetical protein [Bacillota bacterium]